MQDVVAMRTLTKNSRAESFIKLPDYGTIERDFLQHQIILIGLLRKLMVTVVEKRMMSSNKKDVEKPYFYI